MSKKLRVGIIGTGNISHSHMAGYKALSDEVEVIAACDIDEKKLTFAQNIGFERVSDSDKPSVIIEASGAGAALNDGLARVSAFGRVIIVGNASRNMSLEPSNYSHILRKQLSIFGSWNSNYKSDDNDWKECIDAIAKGYIEPEKLITQRFSLDEVDAFYKLISERNEFFQKIIITTKENY